MPENAGYVTAEAIKSRKEFFLYESSPLTKRNRQRPIYHRHTHLGHDRIKIYPHPVEDDGSPIDLATQEVDLNLPHVNVSSVTHPGSYTSVGQYFYFDHDEMTALLGITTWNFDVVEILVVRDGVTIFTGDVKLWDNTNNNSIAVGPGLGHGRKQPNSTSAGGDWMIGDKIFLPGNIFQDDMRNVQVDYIRKPITPNWGYVVVNDKALYNSTSSTDFQLHLSEESELVYRILAFAGIAIEKPQLTQVAASLEGAKIQQEKQ